MATKQSDFLQWKMDHCQLYLPNYSWGPHCPNNNNNKKIDGHGLLPSYVCDRYYITHLESMICGLVVPSM